MISIFFNGNELCDKELILNYGLRDNDVIKVKNKNWLNQKTLLQFKLFVNDTFTYFTFI